MNKYNYAYRVASTTREMYRFTTPGRDYQYWSTNTKSWSQGIHLRWGERSHGTKRIPDSVVLLRGASV